MDAHLVAVPGVGTITARRTARRDHELLGGNANWSLDLVVEFLRLGYDLGTCLLKRARFFSSEGHADSLDLFLDLLLIDLVFVSTVHFQISKANFLINNKPINAHSYLYDAPIYSTHFSHLCLPALTHPSISLSL